MKSDFTIRVLVSRAIKALLSLLLLILMPGCTQISSYKNNPDVYYQNTSVNDGRVEEIVVTGMRGGERQSRERYDTPPNAHFWEYLEKWGDESSGFSTYSYVLVGRSATSLEATDRYLQLVYAITGSFTQASRSPIIVDPRHYNIFYIPGRRPVADQRPTLDTELSKFILSQISTSSELDLSRPGPYIVTFSRPLSDEPDSPFADFLYVDLTDIQLQAIPELVAVYSRRVTEDNLSGEEKLGSLRIKVLNTLLTLESTIGFSRVAYAQLRDAFEFE